VILAVWKTQTHRTTPRLSAYLKMKTRTAIKETTGRNFVTRRRRRRRCSL